MIITAAALCFAACAKKTESGGLTIKQGKLIVGMEISYPPLEYYEDDGKTPTGFDVELAKAVCRELGLEPQFVDAEFGGLFGGINAGKFDVLMSGVTITSERKEAFSFSKPYIGNAMTIVVLNDASFNIEKPEDIAEHNVCYQENTTAQIYAENLKAQGVNYKEFKYASVMNCFEDLKLGRVDVVIVDSLVAFEYIKRDPDLYKVVYQGQADEFMGVCIKKGSDELTEKINQAIDNVRSSGELAEISQKYFGMDLVSDLN